MQDHHKENMEPEPSANVAPSKLTYVFYNDRGLRAGWRLLIYFGMIFVLIFGAGLIARRLALHSQRARHHQTSLARSCKQSAN